MVFRLNFKAYQKHKIGTNAFIEKTKKLNLKTDDWDAVSFFQNGNSGEYRFVIIKFLPEKGKDSVDYVMNEEGLVIYFMLLMTMGRVISSWMMLLWVTPRTSGSIVSSVQDVAVTSSRSALRELRQLMRYSVKLEMRLQCLRKW